MSRIFDSSQTGVNETKLQTSPSPIYNNLRSWTISVWCKIHSFPPVGSDSFLLVKDPTNTFSIGLNLVTNSIGTFLNAFGVTFSEQGVNQSLEGIFSIGVWINFVATFDPATTPRCSIYMNGISFGAFPQNFTGSAVDDSGDGWWIGNDSFDDGFDGEIAEVAIWNAALSPSDVAKIAASTNGIAGIQESALVAYYHICGITSPEPDASGNGNSAVLSINPPFPGEDSPGFSCSGFSTSNFGDLTVVPQGPQTIIEKILPIVFVVGQENTVAVAKGRISNVTTIIGGIKELEI